MREQGLSASSLLSRVFKCEVALPSGKRSYKARGRKRTVKTAEPSRWQPAARHSRAAAVIRSVD